MTEPPEASAGCTIEDIDPVSVSCGWAGLPSASTEVWPGNTIEVSSSRVLCRMTRTFCPEVTHSVGPGSWNLAVLMP